MSFLFLAALTLSSQCGDLQTTVEIVDCVKAAYAKADAQMASVYFGRMREMKQLDADAISQKRRLPAGEPTYSQALLESQRKWIAYRDAQCRLAGYSMRGGSGQGYSTGFCLIDLTEQRTRQLRDLSF